MVDGDVIRNRAQLDEVVEESRNILAMPTNATFEPSDDSDSESAYSSSSEDDSTEPGYQVKPAEGLNLVIRAFDKLEDGEAELLLRDIMPSYVILYDSEPNFVRALEIYSNSLHALDESSDRLQVFFLLYEASAEESSFLQALDREKNAVERLIDHKKRMPYSLPTFNNFSTQEMQQAGGGAGGSYAGGRLVRHRDILTCCCCLLADGLLDYYTYTAFIDGHSDWRR